MDTNKLEAILGADTKISGNLFFKGPAEINSQIEGEIIGESLITIGQTAVLNSSVKSNEVIIYGNVTGDVYAKERISLKDTAIVSGNIQAPSIQIEDGAIFNGQCIMKQEISSSFIKENKDTGILNKKFLPKKEDKENKE
ncbi:MAG: bactofilin family protein [Bdellovibrionota bacterium]